MRERLFSSYIFGFAAGEFQHTTEKHGQTELTYLSTTATPEGLGRLFASTASMLQFFEQKAGVSFPQRRYVQLHVTGSAAQEAMNFSVLGDEVLAPMLTTPEEDWAIAHELAHQWWGNLVTCADWTHFWLNEGITTFMVAAWKEHRWGRPAYDRELAILQRRADEATAAGLDVPLTYSGGYPSLGLRRAITYSKGALFMDRLRRELGDGCSGVRCSVTREPTPEKLSRAVTFSALSSRQAGAICGRSSHSGCTDGDRASSHSLNGGRDERGPAGIRCAAQNLPGPDE